MSTSISPPTSLAMILRALKLPTVSRHAEEISTLPKLTQDDEAWRLVVEPRPFDMLLDRIPWGYGTLKLPWMAQVLHVDWR